MLQKNLVLIWNLKLGEFHTTWCRWYERYKGEKAKKAKKAIKVIKAIKETTARRAREALLARKVTRCERYAWCSSPKGDQGVQGPRGPKGDRGNDGTGLTLKVFVLGQIYNHGDYVFSKSSKDNHDSMYIAERTFNYKRTCFDMDLETAVPMHHVV